MPNFVEGAVWDKTSWNAKAQRRDPNHESDMPFGEVTRIVAESVGLLPGGAVPGEAGEYFDSYKAALQSPTATITVVKGIHQRDDKPHIRVSLAHKGEQVSYHVNLVTADRVTFDVDGYDLGVRQQPFVWRAAQVSVGVAQGEGEDSLIYGYPVGDPPRSFGGRARGLSFTQGQRVDHIEHATANVLERERLEKERLAAEQKASKLLAEQAEKARLDRLKLGQSPWAKLK